MTKFFDSYRSDITIEYVNISHNNTQLKSTHLYIFTQYTNI